MNDSRLNKQIRIALLSGIAFVLMYFDFPLPFFPPFLKIDVSDIPALIGAFSLGPVAGIVIELIKNILYTLIKGSSSMFIGEFANFAIGATWVFVAGFIYNRNRTFKTAIIGLVSSVLAMTVMAVLLNYFVLLPMYVNVFKVDLGGSIGSFIAVATVPFNILKGAISSTATVLLYKPVIAVINRQSIRTVKY
ncbi:Riboflavin transporter RibU [compost metagenome]|uniref:Riboflavin transporter n=1 Tax=Clostridium intestinale DSM 6191 TaxID=1121320 RepID=A0A1M6DRI2_9CLOT|nr:MULTISPECIES: ECF transporter S component [Clostridium]WRY49842.1 ECF transporter S component [Clostridium intestinale]SHI75811.1 Riboflavin transporter FmnP [Clostridium intestinale DSM 6191]